MFTAPGNKTWRNVDRRPDANARRMAHDVFRRLDAVRPSQIGAESDERDPLAIPFLRFDETAQQQFDDWRSALELRLRSNEDHPVIIAHLAKYRSLVPSLALLIHLAESLPGRVGAEVLRRAIGWARYVEAHAYRIYAIAVAPETAEAVALARKITSGALPTEFALRDVYRPKWVGLTSRDAAKRAVDVLQDLDWLAEITEPTAGRSRTRYLVNPKLLRPISDRLTEVTERQESPLQSVLAVSQGEKRSRAMP